MIKANLVFVPAGGGEADYSLWFELPALPHPGDYITIMRPPHQDTEDEKGTIDFIVRRVWWGLEFPSNELYGDPDKPTCGSCHTVAIECEFAVGPLSSEMHKRAARGYAKKKDRPIPTFDASMY